MSSRGPWNSILVFFITLTTRITAAPTPVESTALGIRFQVPEGWQVKETKASSSWVISRDSLRVAVHLIERDALPDEASTLKLQEREAIRLRKRWSRVDLYPVRHATIARRSVTRGEIVFQEKDGSLMAHRTIVTGIDRKPRPVWCILQTVGPRQFAIKSAQVVRRVLSSLSEMPARPPSTPSPSPQASLQPSEEIEEPGEPPEIQPGIHLETVEQRPEFSYHISIPAGYSRERKYPLLLLLHSGGDGGDYMNSVQPAAENASWIIACSNDVDNSVDSKKILEVVDATVMDLLTRFSADPEYVFLGGFSGGGMGSYLTSCFRPGRVAGIVANSGLMHPDLATKEAISRSRIRWAVILSGDQDTVTTRAELKENEALLTQCGAEVLFLTWPGGHSVAPPELYSQALQWLDERREQDAVPRQR